MKRNEQMMNAAEAYAAGCYEGEPVSFSTEESKCETISDFCAGWRAADRHPNWISVEDEMPPFDWKENGTWRRSLPVLIYDPTRGIFVGCYESDDLYGKTYWIYDNGKRPTKEVSGGYELDNVTHWMPIVPPRKEGKV